MRSADTRDAAAAAAPVKDATRLAANFERKCALMARLYWAQTVAPLAADTGTTAAVGAHRWRHGRGAARSGKDGKQRTAARPLPSTSWRNIQSHTDKHSHTSPATQTHKQPPMQTYTNTQTHIPPRFGAWCAATHNQHIMSLAAVDRSRQLSRQ